MKAGDPVQYFDELGRNHNAVVVSTQGPGVRPALTLVAVIEGEAVTKSDVLHRDATLVLQPPREVRAKPTPQGKDKGEPGRLLMVIEGEYKRTPGRAFWFE